MFSIDKNTGREDYFAKMILGYLLKSNVFRKLNKRQFDVLIDESRVERSMSEIKM